MDIVSIPGFMVIVENVVLGDLQHPNINVLGGGGEVT